MDRSKWKFALAGLSGFGLAGVARARRTNTHGRWPWLAALAAPPVTIALTENRPRLRGAGHTAIWTALPLLLWHQTEEWVLPAGFLPWINHSLWKSGDDEFPLTPTIAFGVNVVAGWGLSVSAATTVDRVPWLASAVLSSHIANGALHIGSAVRERRYNPGLATAPALGALGLIGTSGLIKEERDTAFGALVGLAASAGLAIALRMRGSKTS